MATTSEPGDAADALSGPDRARLEYLGAPRGVDVHLDALDGFTDSDRAELDDLRLLLADDGLWAEPPAGLEDSILGLIGAEAADRSSAPDRSEPAAGEHAAAAPGAPTATPAGADGTAGLDTVDASDSVAGFADGPVDLAAARDRRLAREAAGIPSTGRPGRPRRRWARPAILAAAAAVVAAAVLSGVLIFRSPTPEFTATLTGTELAPGAEGTVTMLRTESGWDIRLNATGLPRLDGGDFYQAWLRNEDGVLIPVGSFNEGVDVILWGGVNPARFPTFTVTRETADGDQASSGQRVLVGTAEPTG